MSVDRGENVEAPPPRFEPTEPKIRRLPPGPMPPQYAPPTQYMGRPPGGRRRVLVGVALALAILLGAAALTVGIVALVRKPAPTVASAPPSNPKVSTDADHALCQAIGPLMKENDDRSNAFLAAGQPGSPERDAALPKFVSDTQAWAVRTQQVLDAHATPPRFMARALQRYIDDMQLFAASVRPGPGTQYDEAAWTDSIVAYGGPLSACQALGIGW
jgi:hypothetical protein